MDGARRLVVFLALLAVPALAAAQTPPVSGTPPQPAGTQVPVAVAPQAQTAAVNPDVAPTEAMLGAPILPNAQYITSYDAGQGQRYYLFGTNMAFVDVVAYYRTVLKDKGDLVFEEPTPVHEFDIGKFREDTMAFPPSVTVKDYSSVQGGYLNPKLGATPQRFKTIIQFVPAPR